MGDFNSLLSVQDKNGPLSSITDTLAFRNVIHDLGLIDLPLLNMSFTWSNGRRLSTPERLDWALFLRIGMALSVLHTSGSAATKV